MQADPAFQALQRTDGNAHVALIEDLTGAFQAGKSQNDFESIKKTYLLDVMKRFGPFAASDALLAYAGEGLRIGRKFQSSDAALCHAYATDNADMRAAVQAAMSPEDRTALSNAAAAVLDTSTSQPGGYIDANKAPESLNKIMLDLQTTFGGDVALLAQPANPDVDKAKVCEMSLALQEGIANLPKDDAADVLRLMLSQTNATPAAVAPAAPAASEQPAAQPADSAVTVTDIDLQAVDQELLKQPLYQAIAGAEPERYREFVIKIAQSAKSGGNATDAIQANSGALTRDILKKYLPLTTDDALLGYFKLATSVTEKIGAQDPAACYAFYETGELPPNAAILMSQNDQRQMVQVMTNVIRNGAGKAPKAPDLETVQAAMNDVLTKVTPESAAILGKASQGEQPQPLEGCQASVELYKQVTRLPRAKAAPVLRQFLANP